MEQSILSFSKLTAYFIWPINVKCAQKKNLIGNSDDMSVIVCEMTHSFNDLLEWFDFKFHSRNSQLKLQHESLKARVWNCAAEIISSNQFFFLQCKIINYDCIQFERYINPAEVVSDDEIHIYGQFWFTLRKSINRKCIFSAFSLYLSVLFSSI